MTAGSSIVAMSCIRPEQRGQRRMLLFAVYAALKPYADGPPQAGTA